IGHTQAAAGVAGVIKTVMAMRHGVLPKTLHVDAPTPAADWSSGDVELLTEAREWPARDGLRRAGVSAFGISGTNTHVILEAEADAVPADSQDRAADTAPRLVPWVVSGRGAGALTHQAAALAEFVRGDGAADPVDVAWSLLTTRTVFEDRAVVLGADRDQLLTRLDALAQGNDTIGVVRGVAGEGALGVVFTGQGAQRVGMGLGLCGAFPVFAEAFAAVCSELDPLLGC
ncbi:ketoacyl-synthetase C-terminal extension domain-containing protein, partial [Yinghuangia sp. YIM S10712]|uniref:ketoacyl-synthetase C-terminal extension domain-containing protein n=1 Tax=Yinghuangia sp. YIM S10712 TaxID=3436930 RepID=UPI003F532944